MFFTATARVAAWLAIILGAIRIALALFAMNTEDPNFAMQYLGRVTTGEALDQGIDMVLFGLIVGVLTDISHSVARRRHAS